MKTKPTKSQQLSKDGRTVDPLTYIRNRARIKAQEEAVRSGKLKPIILPAGRTEY